MPSDTPFSSDQVSRIGVVSDTHGHTVFARQAVRMLESLDVQLVLHCGDIGTAEIVELFAPWPTHFVFGNTDYDRQPLRAAIVAAGQTCHERFGALDVGACRIAFLHGDDMRALVDAGGSGRYDLVCYGHTHQAEQHRQGSTLVLNPGALYRANPHSFAVVTLPELEAMVINL
jgi:putative phosphoesterase